ncbi:hypothetical protein DFH07DRAFT_806016 [Mycena maculata]|uniref:Uncharacterized protein n=1 Tax=Mycena maculata TaxID=230809 RepID=A0AAD7NPZ5_9AGAR|nr:hypothetical protein DFH07DRAFT_806016 [Mycena maculata]
MAAQFAPTRNANNSIVLYLSPTQPAPIVPVELRGEITPDVWADRLRSITVTASRYNKPMFERLWTTIGLLAIIIVPVALFQVILSALHLRSDPTEKGVFEARAISMGIFVGLVCFFIVPIAIWKYIGRKQVNSMLKKWEKADEARGASKSTWTVKTPGIFRSSIILNIQLPPGVAVSGFHINAYLPSYINGPADPDANYYYPYKSAEPGLPRMSVVGNVPLFTDEKRGFPGTEQV